MYLFKNKKHSSGLCVYKKVFFKKSNKRNRKLNEQKERKAGLIEYRIRRILQGATRQTYQLKDLVDQMFFMNHEYAQDVAVDY